MKEVKLSFDLLEELNRLKNITLQTRERKSYLYECLSLLDKKLVDIQHCAEFYELDACKGYKLYKILHDTTIERREVKNELEVLKLIETKKFNLDNMTNMEKFYIKQFDSDNKKYRNRVVDDLFDLVK